MLEALNKNKKLELAKKMFEDAVTYDVKWQKEAREDFRFRDGIQWKPEEEEILKEEMRPYLVLNVTKSSIDLVMGMNEDNRKKFRASPVETQDSFLSEVLNDIDENISDYNEFTDEEDGALESAAICGRGYVAIDFVPDPNRFGEIQISEVAVPVHEVHFDPSARRPTLEDASYICWDRWLTKQDFKLRYPKIAEKQIDDIISTNNQLMNLSISDDPQSTFDVDPELNEDDSDYDVPMDTHDYLYFNNTKNMIRVIHLEYWESYKRYFGFDPESGDWKEFTGVPLVQAKLNFAKQYSGQELQYETLMDKKVRWLQFTGDRILYDDDSPIPYHGFSIVPCFAYRDVSGRTANHFGIVRLLKDPQREINKRWSQALNMLNQQVQPGLYAEIDSFVDVRQAEQSLKEAGSIAWTQPGALQGQKIKERTVPSFPNAPMQMEQFSREILKQISGINPDLLGQDRGRQDAGVVIRLRQQQGFTLLKPLFKSFNKMKKILFKMRLAIIMQYMPDNQILRILGEGDNYNIDPATGIISSKQNFQAELRDVRNLKYNIKTEEAPGNISKRMLEVATFTEMMQAGFPVDPITVIEKLELSASEKSRWIQYIQNQQQAQSQQAQQAFQAEVEFKDREIRVDEQKNLIEFITSLAKIDQMSSKDKMKLAVDFAKLNEQNKSEVRNFIANMFQITAQLEQNKIDNLTSLMTEKMRGENKSGESKNSVSSKGHESNK